MTSKCPLHSNGQIIQLERPGPVASITTMEIIRNRMEQSLGFVDETQALYAFRIYELGGRMKELKTLLLAGVDDFLETNETFTYKQFADELKESLLRYGRKMFSQSEKNPTHLDRLVAGLNTFHSFCKRAAMTTKSRDSSIGEFPYRQAVRFASTSNKRADMMATHPDIKGWEGLFFDPDVDVSKMYLGYLPDITVYKCPVLYSGKFREIIDMYSEILYLGWEKSQDKPTQDQLAVYFQENVK